MGLLDFMGSGDMDDPKTQATLALASGLLSTRGMRGLVQGMQGYQQTMSQHKQQQVAEQMRQMQLEQHALQLQQARKQQEQAERDRIGMVQQMTPISGIEANRASGITGPRPEALGVVGQTPRLDVQSMIRQGMSPQAISTLMQLTAKEQPKLESVKPGETLGYFQNGKFQQVFQAPDKAATSTDLGKLIAEAQSLPPGHPMASVYQAAIRKATTHAPATSVSYGAPMAGVDPKTGQPIFFQPGKDGGPAAIIPNVAPPKPKLGEKQANQNAGIDALSSAVDDYVSQLGSWKKSDALKPDRRAEIGTVYNNVMLQAKEAYNLGVLNGPDLKILTDVVQDPLTIAGTLTSNEALARQATSLKRIMNKIKAMNLGTAQPGAQQSPQNDPLGLFNESN